MLAANKLIINETVSPDDNMVTTDLQAYFRTSHSGLECILAGLSAAGKQPEDIHSVLDFGCAYGRIYRAIAAMFPHAQLTACDLMKDAAKFCAKTFGGDWVQSNENFSKVKFPREYDLIWLGSVFTHLPAYRWCALFALLANATEKGGTVIFTVHGERSIWQIENFLMKRNPHVIDADRYEIMKNTIQFVGFDFIPSKPAALKYQRRKGMGVSDGEYGFSFSAEWWVTQLVNQLPEWQLVEYRKEGWGGNHDVVTLTRV